MKPNKDIESDILNEFKERIVQADSNKWKCLLCGRHKFTHKSPHNCVGGFRKRKIIWQQVQKHVI